MSAVDLISRGLADADQRRGRVVSGAVALVPEAVVAYTGGGPRRSTNLPDALAVLPPIYDTQPGAADALGVATTTGDCTVRVEGTLLEVVDLDGSVPPFVCDLRDFTIGTLAARLQQAGFLVNVPGAWSALAATVLIDAFYPAAPSHTLRGYTSVLWRVVRPLALCFDMWGDDLAEATRQMDVRHAAGRWLDWWGVLYGVPRATGELDAGYRRRIVWEVMAPRANNVAMEVILKEALGVDATITDVSTVARTWYATTADALYAASSNGAQTDLALAPYLGGAQIPPILNTAGIADPATPVAATAVTPAPVSALPAGVYRVGYTLTNGAGETLLSPLATVILAAGQAVRVPAITLPGGATGVKYYLVSPVQTWDTLTGASYNATTYTWATTDANVLTWGLTNPTGIARPSVVWMSIPPLVAPATFAQTYPGAAGWFAVDIRQVIEEGQLGDVTVRGLIERYKAAGFRFTLSIRTAYTEMYDGGTLIDERYAEEMGEAGSAFAGRFYVTATRSSLTGVAPEFAPSPDRALLVPLRLGGQIILLPQPAGARTPWPIWEESIYEEISEDDGLTWRPGGVATILAANPDTTGVVARRLGGRTHPQRLAPPGVIPGG